MVSVNRILCPIDFSKHSRQALDHAALLARWYEGQITVLHVFHVPQPAMPVSGTLGNAPVIPPMRPADEIEEDIRLFCGPLTTTHRPEIVAKAGVPAKEIVQHADQISADLLVMGTHGREGFERLVLGSVTEKVLRTTRRPVLTVPPPPVSHLGGAPLYKTILCPIDFSDASTRALEFALSLAKEGDARLILLHVIEGFVDPSQLGENVHFTVPEYSRHLETDAMRRLKAAVPDQARVWCKPEEHVTSGKAYREILRMAADIGVQLIVMGAHGSNPMSAWLFGSTVQHVVRQATCPVLTLRSQVVAQTHIWYPLGADLETIRTSWLS